MRTLQLITGVVTGNGSPLQPFSPIAGDSFTTRKFSPAFMAHLTGVWILSSAPVQVTLRSSRFHDINPGLVLQSAVTNFSNNLISSRYDFRIYPEDNLQIFLLGSLAQVTILLQIEYDNLLEVNTRFITKEQLKTLGKTSRSLAYANPAPSASAYTSQMSLSDGLFKYDKDYALTGFQGGSSLSFLRFKSEEQGNFPFGMPIDDLSNTTQDFFPVLSDRYDNLPVIPIFSGIKISTSIVESIGFVPITGVLNFVELKT